MKKTRKNKVSTSKERKKVELNKNTSIENMKNSWIWLLAVVLFTFISFYPALDNEITNWDDDKYITKNPLLREISVENLQRTFFDEDPKILYYMGNYHPLTMLSLSLDYQLAGEDKDGNLHVWSYHLSNVLLHIANTGLLFFVIYLLFQNFRLALIVAAFFGVSTIHVESVAWVSERKDVLYTLFYLASLFSYLKYYRSDFKAKYYILSLFFFVLSLLSKGQAVSLAVSLIAVDFVLSRKLLTKKVILEKIPYFALALFFGIVAIMAQKAGDAIHGINDYAFYKRIGFAGYAFAQYLIKLAAPFELAAIYPYPDIINRSIPDFYWLFMLPTLAVVYAFFYYLKREKIISFGIAFFTINIGLLLQLIPVGSAIMADRYAYIPSIGFFILLAAVYELFNKQKTNKTIVWQATYGLYFVFFIFMTMQRSEVWENSLALWDDTVEKSPKAVVAWNNRGSIRDKAKDHENAIKDFTIAIMHKPDYAHAFYNRGTAKKEWASEKNDSTLYRSAEYDFTQAIRFKPELVDAYQNRGISIESIADFLTDSVQFRKQIEMALVDYNSALDIEPNHPGSLVNRGVAQGKLGFLAQAIVDFNLALKIDPNDPKIYSNRGLAYDHLKEYEKSIVDYTKAIEFDPEFVTAYRNRAIVYRKLNKHEQAIADFSKAIVFAPEILDLYYYRALSYLELKQTDLACIDFVQAAQRGYRPALLAQQLYCLSDAKANQNKLVDNTNKKDKNEK